VMDDPDREAISVGRIACQRVCRHPRANKLAMIGMDEYAGPQKLPR
jgi:hypothetical protein